MSESTFTPIDGNPSETVGDTRMLSAEESRGSSENSHQDTEETAVLRIRSNPRTVFEVLSDQLNGTYVLVGLMLAVGVEALMAILADAAFPGLDLNLFFTIMFGGILLFFSVLFFAVVNRSEDDLPDKSAESSGAATLTVGPEHYRVTTRGLLLGERTRLRGDSIEVIETLNRLNTHRIGPSTEFVSTLRPTGSLQNFMVAAMTDRDRQWLAGQFEVE